MDRLPGPVLLYSLFVCLFVWPDHFWHTPLLLELGHMNGFVPARVGNYFTVLANVEIWQI
jgi:hypothetical protein